MERTPVTERHPSSARLLTTVSLSHGLYYLVSGVWPVVDMRSFEFITGRKRDRWLVKAVGLLLGAIGAVLLMAARRGKYPPEVVMLGAGSAGVLATVDIVYYRRGVLRWVYLADAAVELVLVIGWIASWWRPTRSPIER